MLRVTQTRLGGLRCSQTCLGGAVVHARDPALPGGVAYQHGQFPYDPDLPNEPFDSRTGVFPYGARDRGLDIGILPMEPRYSFSRAAKGLNPIRAHQFEEDIDWAPKVYKCSYDKEKHFNNQWRWHFMTFWDCLGYFGMWIWKGRNPLLSVVYAGWAYTMTAHWHRNREPPELHVDREEFFRDADLWNYGAELDHHAFDHMLAHRRANKWGYEDVTLKNVHH